MAKQSLFAQGVSQAPASGGMLSQMPAASDSLDAIPPRDDGPFSPYVEFAVSGKGRWDAIKESCPDVQDCDPVLRRDGEYTRLVPLTFFLIDGFRYFASLDADYKPVRAWREKPENEREKVHEYVQLLIAVMTPAGPVAATMRARDGLCRGVSRAIDAKREAASPEWANKSADHAMTMRIPDPRFRFKCELRPGHSVSRTTGRSYQTTSGKILPASAADVALLTQADSTQLDVAKAEFDRQKATIEALVGK